MFYMRRDVWIHYDLWWHDCYSIVKYWIQTSEITVKWSVGVKHFWGLHLVVILVHWLYEHFMLTSKISPIISADWCNDPLLLCIGRLSPLPHPSLPLPECLSFTHLSVSTSSVWKPIFNFDQRWNDCSPLSIFLFSPPTAVVIETETCMCMCFCACEFVCDCEHLCSSWSLQ